MLSLVVACALAAAPKAIPETKKGEAVEAAPLGNPVLEAAEKARASSAADAGTAVAPAPATPAAKAPETIGLATDAGAAAGTKAEPAKGAAMPADVKELVDRMQAFYEKTQDFTADFRQDYFYKTFKRTQTSTGKVSYRKPALMRWEYEKPSPKTFVLAGERVYAYDPEAMLLTRAAISTNQLSASVTFLWGQGKLADEFSIAKKACPTCTGTLLELTPLRPDPRFRQVRLEVDPKTASVIKSTVVDPDGSENAITFLKLTPNVGVDEKSFKLSPPPGTQVQDFLGGGAPAAAAKDGGVAGK